jgi:outer membrane lipoprotein-sorting protein
MRLKKMFENNAFVIARSRPLGSATWQSISNSKNGLLPHAPFGRFIAMTIVVSLFLSFPFAANAGQKEDLGRIEAYLNGITNFIAPFTQTDSAGEETHGTFYLSRPGKLRWEYAPPYPILIIAKGSLLTYYDKELDEVSHVSLEDNLSGFLTRQNISFDDPGIEIVDLKKTDGNIYITITQKNKKEDGVLTLVFADKKIELKKMEMLDSIGKKTLVSFDTIVYDKPIDKSMFTLSKSQRKK